LESILVGPGLSFDFEIGLSLNNSGIRFRFLLTGCCPKLITFNQREHQNEIEIQQVSDRSRICQLSGALQLTDDISVRSCGTKLQPKGTHKNILGQAFKAAGAVKITLEGNSGELGSPASARVRRTLA